MDKLEKALEKARKLRSGKLPGLALARGGMEAVSGNAAALSDVVLPPPVNNAIEIRPEVLERYHIVAYRTRSKEADIFRILRTQILQIMHDAGYKTLAITSANYGDGKTTVSLNLALGIALDLKQTALLVDLDLRKPGITSYLGINSASGLTDYLMMDRPIADCMLRTSFERLSILPAGRGLDNSSEVLASPKMAALAHELKARYADRMIIYDMPPTLAQDDAIAFLPNVDAVLVIVNEGVTRVEDIKRAMTALAKANVIGIVLNNSAKKPSRTSQLIKKWLTKI